MGLHMSYNIRVIEHFNGSIQIQQYDDLVGVDSSSKQKWDIEPFEGKKVRVVSELVDNSERNRQKSLAHTKNMINTYARAALWEWFVTFTFSTECVDRTNFKECMTKVRNWLNNVRKRLANDLQYLAVPELHADRTSWHIHLLLSNIGSIPLSDSGRKISGNIVYNITNWKYGFSTATKVRDIYRIQTYICKYMTKDCHQFATGAHRYYASRNLPLPIKSDFFIPPEEQEEFIKCTVESFGKNIVYVSHTKPDAYVQTTYYELN